MKDENVEEVLQNLDAVIAKEDPFDDVRIEIDSSRGGEDNFRENYGIAQILGLPDKSSLAQFYKMVYPTMPPDEAFEEYDAQAQDYLRAYFRVKGAKARSTDDSIPNEIMDKAGYALSMYREAVAELTSKTQEHPDPEQSSRFASYPKDAMDRVYKIKDRLRSHIFHHAKEWLDTGRLESFVYPVNHFKIPTIHDREYPVGTILPNKFGDTLSLPETMLVFSDVHQQVHSRRTGTKNIQRGDPQMLAQSLTPTSILHPDDVLSDIYEYPLSEYSGARMHSIQKELLEKVREKKPKTLDLHILFPSQDTDAWESGFDNPINTGGETKYGEPAKIMLGSSSYPQYMGQENIRKRKMIDDLKGNPEWIGRFRSRIPIEPNYSFAGPEY